MGTGRAGEGSATADQLIEAGSADLAVAKRGDRIGSLIVGNYKKDVGLFLAGRTRKVGRAHQRGDKENHRQDANGCHEQPYLPEHCGASQQ